MLEKLFCDIGVDAYAMRSRTLESIMGNLRKNKVPNPPRFCYLINDSSPHQLQEYPSVLILRMRSVCIEFSNQ